MGQLNPRDKERQRAIDDALQQRMSARFERRIRREIGQTFREAATAYEKRGDLAIPLALSDHSRGIAEAITADYRTIGQFFGRRLLKDAKAYAPTLITKDGEDLEDLLDLAIDRFSRTWLATKVTQINTTTEHQLRRIITVGLSEGWGVDKIARTMREMAGPLSALRAHVIARTETHTAANFGAQQAAELTGLQMRREWVSASDERTRDTDEADHVAANGQIVGMREPFEVSGESLMFPGDPSGSPENVIMCRCSVAFIYD